MRAIGVLASGEEAAPNELQDARNIGSQMVAFMAASPLLIPWPQTLDIVTAAGQWQYPVTLPGPINSNNVWGKPTHLEHATLLDGSISVPLRIADDEIDRRWVLPGLARPKMVQFDAAPTGPILLVKPTPDAVYTIRVKVLAPMTALPPLLHELDLPDGYERLLRLALAMELSTEYGVMPSQVLVSQYANAASAIKRMNSVARGRTLRVDAALLRSGGYDINQGPV